MRAASNHAGRTLAGLVACGVLAVTPPVPAETNLNKSAIANLAIQFAQQVQAQELANAQTLRELKQQNDATAAAVASLRRWLITGVAVLALAGAALLFRNRPRHNSALRGPVTAQAFVAQAAALEHQGRFPDALTHYERALLLDPVLPAALVGKGRVLNQLGRYREALDCYENADHPPEQIARPAV